MPIISPVEAAVPIDGERAKEGSRLDFRLSCPLGLGWTIGVGWEAPMAGDRPIWHIPASRGIRQYNLADLTTGICA